MPVLAHGRIVVWEGASLWIFKAAGGESRTDYHAHHAVQLTFALEGPFELRTPDEAAAGPVAAVAADARHELRARGIAAMIFVEPDSALGRSLSATWFSGGDLIQLEPSRFEAAIDSLREAFESARPDGELVTLGKSILSNLHPGQPRGPADSRVQAMIDFAANNLDRPISLRNAARHINLSPTRAGHLFVEQTGLPLKTYLLWRRLIRAVEVYSDGATLTHAAHEAGFADSAHFSRTFRRMFGLPATSLRLTLTR